MKSDGADINVHDLVRHKGPKGSLDRRNHGQKPIPRLAHGHVFFAVYNKQQQ